MYHERVLDGADRRTRRVAVLLPVALLAWAPAAEAYIGPGVGLGAIALVAGMIGSIVLWFTAILWYPFRRMLHRRREAMKRSSEEARPRPASVAPTAEDSATS